MKKTPLGARVRLWLLMRFPFGVGIVLLGVIVAVIGACLEIPIGPVQFTKGVVQGFRLGETLTGTRLRVAVRLGPETVYLPLPDGNACQVGSDIWIQRQRRIWGTLNTVDYRMCPSKP